MFVVFVLVYMENYISANLCHVLRIYDKCDLLSKNWSLMQIHQIPFIAFLLSIVTKERTAKVPAFCLVVISLDSWIGFVQ